MPRKAFTASCRTIPRRGLGFASPPRPPEGQARPLGFLVFCFCGYDVLLVLSPASVVFLKVIVFYGVFFMADANGTMPGYPYTYDCYRPLSVELFATDSLRRDLVNQTETIRSGLNNVISAVDHVGSANALAIRDSAAATSLAIQQTSSATLAAIDRTASSAQLQASQNFAALSKQMSECCCEIKEKIASDGQQTRDLINRLETDRLLAENAELRAELRHSRHHHHHGG